MQNTQPLNFDQLRQVRIGDEPPRFQTGGRAVVLLKQIEHEIDVPHWKVHRTIRLTLNVVTPSRWTFTYWHGASTKLTQRCALHSDTVRSAHRERRWMFQFASSSLLGPDGSDDYDASPSLCSCTSRSAQMSDARTTLVIDSAVALFEFPRSFRAKFHNNYDAVGHNVNLVGHQPKLSWRSESVGAVPK